MTREQKDKELFSCEKFVEDYGTTGEHFYKCHTIDDLLDKIFDDHEAQLKANDEEIERLKHDAIHIKLQHDNCGGIIEIDYQLYVRNYETFCPKCNKDLFVTIDFNTRILKEQQ